MPAVGSLPDAVTEISQLGDPIAIGGLIAKGALQSPAGPCGGRSDSCHCASMADHDEGLVVRLDAVEDVGEPPCCFGRAELLHEIRLSDYEKRGSEEPLRGLGQPGPVGQVVDLRLLGVNRLEAGDREDHVAVAAGADLAVDVVELLDNDLVFLFAGGTDDAHLEHGSMVHETPDGQRLSAI